MKYKTLQKIVVRRLVVLAREDRLETTKGDSGCSGIEPWQFTIRLTTIDIDAH